MTMSGDFVPLENEQEAPAYPKLFGVSITPTIGMVALILLGAVGAYFVWTNLVQPLMETNQALRQDISSKEQQLQDQEETQRQIEAARVRLETAQQLQADVTSLFATPESLNTLLLDVNERVQAANAGIQDPTRRATLSQFDINDSLSGVVEDGTFGSEAVQRIERKVYDVQIEGTFPQVQSIIRNLERLQPLLVTTNLRSELDAATRRIVLDNQGRLVPGQPDPRITTSFRLNALLPAETPPPAEGAVDPAAEGVPQ